ncbi:MAG: hypothetical protein ACOYB4_08815 [Methyloceanibacter sp.]
MDSEVSDRPVAKGSGNPLVSFVTSVCAAIVVAGGFGLVVQAFILATANLMGLGSTFVWVGSAANILGTLWLFLWTFARSWHVERRLQAGLEVDEPKFSILANFR